VSAGPYFPSGGFHRDQFDNVGVFLVDLDGNPYAAVGGSGGGGGVVQLQLREGASWVNVPGTAARGLLTDPINGVADANVGLPARVGVVAGYDGTNVRTLKTSAAGVVQVDVLSNPAGGATLAEQQSQTTLLTSIQGRLPAALDADGGLKVHVVNSAGGSAGTEYTEGDVDSTITGRAIMWEDTSDTLRSVSVAKPLPVSQQGTVTVTGPLTDTQLRASAVPVSGPLTDTQLRASAVPVDSELTTADLDTGAGTDTRAVMGLVRAESGGGLLVGSANPLPVTGPLTDTQLRATPVPISGTVTANAGSGPYPVNDNGGSLTVDAPVGTPVFVRLSDGAANLIGQKTMANSLPVVLASDQSALAVSGPLTDAQLRASAVPVSLAANQSVNVAQVAGTATSVNSGVVGAGVQRIVIATDQPALTNALKVDGSAVTQPISGTVTASNTTGNIAHDVADSGNPVKIGARALSADIAAVVANDRSDLLATLLGKLLVMPYALPGATVSGSGNKTDTTDLSLMPAPGAGIRNYVTHITITNAHATVGTKVVLKDGSTIIWRGYADALGGGVSGPLPTPLRLTANTALNGACITTGADVDFSVVGFTAAE
jgi:hypothetical protein